MAGGFTLLFEKEDGTIGVRAIDRDVTIQAAHFAFLADADKGVEFKDDYLEYSPGEVMVDGLGGLFAIDVNGTLEYHIDSYSDWLHSVSESGDVRINRRHAFLADRNETGAERTGDKKPVGHLVGLAGSTEICIDLAGVIDIAVELARVTKEIENTEKNRAKIAFKLDNENFVNKAPADVVERIRTDVAGYDQQLVKLREYKKELESI